MNNKIKNILLFAVYLSLGLSIFLVKDSFSQRECKIYNLYFFLTILAIMLIILSFTFLYKDNNIEEKVIFGKTKKNYKTYVKLTQKEKDLNKKKSIIFILLGIIVFVVSAIFSVNGYLLKITNILITILFIMGIIKFDIKIENKVKEKYRDLQDNIKEKKHKKFKLLYLIFDYVSKEIILCVMMLIIFSIALFIKRKGFFSEFRIDEDYFFWGTFVFGGILSLIISKEYDKYYEINRKRKK